MSSNPKVPTDEQNDVLKATERIRVVRACPGAGKTEMFVEAIRRRLDKWDSPTTGLAALSFTNIARQTIENRVGGVVTAPHFIGTLDAFAFRFIVKPFGHLVGLPKGRVRLFPEAKSDLLESPYVQVGANASISAPLAKVHFCGVKDGKAYARAKTRIETVEISQELMPEIRAAKVEFWKNTGIVTHSDCHFLAGLILHKNAPKFPVRKLIARRFPVLFIDELQDTGYFLARSFVQLCGEPTIEALVVGDPNQAIYSFGGASPTIFEDFAKLSGAKEFSLTLSQRCPKKVAQIASSLSHSKSPVVPKPDAPDGELVIVVHSLAKPKLLPPQAAFLRGLLSGKDLAIISRSRKTAAGISGLVVRDEFRGRSGAARKINRAIQFMGNGDSRAASQIIDRELSRIVLDDEKAGEKELSDQGLTPARWRAAIFSVLTAARAKVEGETWNDWVVRVKGILRDTAVELGWAPEAAALSGYMVCNKKGAKLRNILIDVPVAKLWPETDVINTIHKVKGAEFDTVVVFTPKPDKDNPCPSTEWWSAQAGGEEMRVAFVAVSRSKLKLVLCVHEQTLAALKISQPGFVALFGEPQHLPAK